MVVTVHMTPKQPAPAETLTEHPPGTGESASFAKGITSKLNVVYAETSS